jgi:hypothetical protein
MRGQLQRDLVRQRGPCKTRVRDNTITSIKGTNTENGLSLNPFPDETKETALHMVAGIFPLTGGKVETNICRFTYRWANGYAFDTATL